MGGVKISFIPVVPLAKLFARCPITLHASGQIKMLEPRVPSPWRKNAWFMLAVCMCV